MSPYPVSIRFPWGCRGRPEPAGVIRNLQGVAGLLAILWSVPVVAAAPLVEATRHREIRYVMGTRLDITLYHHHGREARKLLSRGFSLAEHLDTTLSNYKPQSEVSRLNRKGGMGRVPVSPELYQLLEQAKDLNTKTDGAFDVTVGPFLDLWQSAGRQNRVPSPGELMRARSLVGRNQVVLYPDRKVSLQSKGVRIDTGGIGKGYAVDLIAELFEKSPGFVAALINFGQSSVMAMGAPPGSRAWTLLLQFPNHKPAGFVELKDQALSASDSLGRSIEIAGLKYGHLIDPRSGRPSMDRAQAVVIAPSATEAEALSKSVILQGCDSVAGLGGPARIQAIRISPAGPTLCAGPFPLVPLDPMVQ